jgi:hypothetical protein
VAVAGRAVIVTPAPGLMSSSRISLAMAVARSNTTPSGTEAARCAGSQEDAAASARRHASQGDSLTQDTIPDPELQALRRSDLSKNTKRIFNAEGESRHVQVAVASVDIDKQIEVAVRGCFLAPLIRRPGCCARQTACQARLSCRAERELHPA